MNCENCGYVNANPLGCMSCGWKYNPEYHPHLGAQPVALAEWIVTQPMEALEATFGRTVARLKWDLARKFLAEHPKAVPAMPSATVESIVAEPVAPPNFAPAPPVTEPMPMEEPEPVPPAPPPEPVDQRIFAKEAPAPVAD